MALDPRIHEYYERGAEVDRLSNLDRAGPLEMLRTEELISRLLPPGRNLKVLDVGGGPGIYAKWLLDEGHDVTLIDPVALHVQQATSLGVPSELGDARRLGHPDRSADAVLMLGPLYHLVERDDRLLALREAHRVLRPGGLLFAAAISRFAALLDLLIRLDRLHEPAVFDEVARCVTTGRFGTEDSGLFTTSYAHRPGELRDEAESSGFVEVRIFNIEGPGFLVPNFPERWADSDRRTALCDAARLIEEDPDLLGAASHLMLTAAAPG